MPYKNPNYCLSEKYFAQKNQEALAAKNSTTKGLFNLLSVAEGELLKDGVDTKDLDSLASLAKTLKGSSADSEWTEETEDDSYWDDISVMTGQTGKTNLTALSKAINDFENYSNKMIPKDEKDLFEIYNSTDSVSTGTTYFSLPNNLLPLKGEW